MITNILSKNIVKKLLLIIGFVLLFINFSTNFFNGGEEELFGSISFLEFQNDSESLVINEIFNDKYNLINNKYGLSKGGSFDVDWLNKNLVNESSDLKNTVKNISIDSYMSQVGLQGHVISFLYNKINLSIDTIKRILISLLAVVLIYICKYISIKFNKKLSLIFYLVFFLSPWICAFARNLYWVEFTWFIPMLLGLILSTDYSKKKIIVPLVFLSIFIKCLCGYEYITVIMLAMIMFMLYDLIFEKNKDKKKEIFKTIFIVGFTAMLGFLCALMIHSYLRGNGNLVDGLKLIYVQDIARRVVTPANNSSFDGILLQSIQASPLTTLNIYFYWSTNIITGINGSLFRLLFVFSILVLIFNFMLNRKDSRKNLILYIFSFITCISWFIISSPHSYIHTHMNYVLWYFGFIQIMLYVIIDSIVYIIKNFIDNNKSKELIENIDIIKFEKKEYKPKKNKYCLCIPIINEGEKIKKELEKAQKHGIDTLVDIIICDGDSTDGSTKKSILKKLGVNTLLIKKDLGKQGAQLRMGFLYAIERGYEGIITIDGNNKDSIEDVVKFIKKLDEGYDFVQGSRFIKGGRAVNTPKVRLIALKLLHAPIISLTAGEKFTDTTNNFRAYSKRYLTNPNVQPFRKVFQTYELLAYLSVKASQLGLKTCEIPVKRKYPKRGKTPTKISPLKGNYELLKILFKNAFGHYDVGMEDVNGI